ncbi:phosphoesterase, partial [Pseudomonas syringae]
MSKTVAPPCSRSINPWIYLGIPVAVALTLMLLELTSLDMDIAKLAFDPVSGQFIGRHSYFLEDILHDRAKQLVMLFGVLAMIGFAASFKVQRLMPWRRELGCLVLSMALSTAFVTPVKVVTSVQCPWSLKEFGGQETYSELLSPRPATDKPGRCWPGGHA